jgi:hypothetical protein
MQKLLFLALAFSLCFHSCDQTIDMRDLTFYNNENGCCDFHITEIATNDRVTLTVSADIELLDLQVDNEKSFNIGQDSLFTITLNKYNKTLSFSDLYNDVIDENRPKITETHTAKSGTILITQETERISGETYKVSITLTNVVFENQEGEELTIDEESMSNVQVGWYPG